MQNIVRRRLHGTGDERRKRAALEIAVAKAQESELKPEEPKQQSLNFLPSTSGGPVSMDPTLSMRSVKSSV